jgi:hypothetical protein
MDISTSAPGARSTEGAGQDILTAAQGRASGVEDGRFITAFVARNGLTVGLIVSAVLVVLLTPIGSLAPLPTGDNSWHAALAMAFNQNVQFGPHAIFTYGPLGFLEFPQLYFTSTFIFAILYVTAIHLLLFAALYWSLSRSLAKGWAVVLAVAGTWGVAAALLATPQGVSPASPGLIFVGGPVLIWCCALVRDDLSEHLTKVMPLLLGSGTALLILVETNMSVLVGALSVIALLSAKGQRLVRVFAFAGGCVVMFMVFWVSDGQAVANIGSYLHGAEQISSGYTAAMAVENAPVWQYLGAFVLAVLVGIIVYFASTRRSFHLTWAPMVLVATFLFFAFKETFVVHGPAHKAIAFAACLVALLAVPTTAGSRRPLVGSLILTSLVLVAVNGFDSTFNALKNGMETSIRVPATVVSPARRFEEMQTVRKQIQEGYVPGLALGPTTVGLARGKTTYIQDGQAGISWAYPSLTWQPLPVLQEYSAYTPYLDQLNAEFIASKNGPERILRPPSSATGSEVPAFESPAAVVSLVCHYAQLGASSSWQVLGMVPDHCGPMHQISVVHTRIGQTIEVPQPTRPDEAVIARVTALPLPLTTAPLSFLLKTSSINIVVNHNAVPNRFIVATAAQPHLMIQPRDLGYSCLFSYQPIDRFSITGGGDSSGTAGVIVKFYSMPVAPVGGSSISCAGESS